VTQSYSDLVCQNFPAGTTTCPAGGNVMRDQTITFGGTPGTTFNVKLRVRGVLAPKHYVGGAVGTPANGDEPRAPCGRNAEYRGLL